MGSGYVIGSLLEEGIDVKFFNMNNMVGSNWVEQTIQNHKRNEVVRQILDENCEIVFFSILTIDLEQALDIVRKIKKVRNIPVMFGGVHPTIVGIKLLEEYPEIDYICVGEGESMVKEFTQGVRKDEIRNLGWRNGDGTPTLNQIRDPEDITIISAFPWHIYPKEYIIKDDGIIYVRATRGCPYRCTYCGNSAYLKLYGKGYLRKRPIPDILEELTLPQTRIQPQTIIVY